jgi:hypothetical protein
MGAPAGTTFVSHGLKYIIRPGPTGVLRPYPVSGHPVAIGAAIAVAAVLAGYGLYKYFRTDKGNAAS